MEPLQNKSCEACTVGAPFATISEIDQLSIQIPEWKVVEVLEIKRLTRTYVFGDFSAAIEFTNKVGAIAEQENHHPAILTEWGKTTVSWWTHKIGGLHVNDFIMAAKTDTLID